MTAPEFGDDLDVITATEARVHATDAIGQVVQQLATIRRARGLSQERVATALGLHHTAVAKFERDDKGTRHWFVLHRYALAIGAKITITVEADPPLDGHE